MEYERRFAQAQGAYQRGLEKVKNEPEPEGQKFPCGSFVMIDKDLGSHKSHFTSDTIAKVDHVYSHAYGGSDIKSYSLLVKQHNGKWSSCAWYEEHELSVAMNINVSDLINEIGDREKE